MENELLIVGFKCFDEQAVLFKRLTVLAGGNSVGKSSVVQSLLLLRLAYEKRKAGIDKIPLNGEYALRLGNSFDVIARQTSASGGTMIIQFTHQGEYKGAEFLADEKEAQVFLTTDDTYGNVEAGGAHPITRENFHYLNAERLGPRSVYQVSDIGRSVGSQGEHTIALLSSSAANTPEYDVAAAKMYPETKSPRLLSQAGFWMNDVIPGIEISPKKILETNQAIVQYGGAMPFNVGFGISYVLPIVVSGLIAQKGDMLIVENPEAHLHPSGQSRIGRFLAVVAAAGVEVVVETHSEHVINGIRVAALKEQILPSQVSINFFSAADGPETSQPVIRNLSLNENADLDYWPKGFFDQQQEDIAQIFKLRKQKRK